MTGNTNKVRAVFLAMLMVFSVFAGTVAFSGSAAAAQPTFGGNAVHYTDSGGNAVIEVPFENGNVSRASLTEQNFTVLDDGDNITADVVDGYRKLGNTSGSANGPSRSNATVIIELSRVVPSSDLEVDLSGDIRSEPANDTIANAGEKSVVFAGQTIEHDTAKFGPVGADAQANPNSNNITAYQGVTVAVNASNITNQGKTFLNTRGVGNIDVTVEGEDNNYFQEGNTGNNSSVFTFDTSDRELGKYRIFLNGSDNQFNRTFINVRNLGLGVSVDDLTVSTDDTIETTTTAVASGRPVNVELLDSGGDAISATATTLGGQGEVDVDFDTSAADGGNTLATGTYTVEVTDNRTGVTVASSQIDVTAADDESAEFVESTITEQRGDILETTVELTETSTATINFGSSSDGVQANATVEDDDGDDQVTVYINTFRMDTNSNANIFNIDSDSDDNIIAQQTTTQTSDLIDAGDYDLEVEAGDVDFGSNSEPGVSSSDDVATVTLESRSTENVQMWTGSSDEIGSFSDLEDVNEAINEGTLTQSSEIAVGDLAVHQIQVTGLEGRLDARANEDVTSNFFQADGGAKGPNNGPNPINLTIEEADPGANQGAEEINLSAANTTVIADGPSDTYFVSVDTGDLEFGHDGGDKTALPNDDDTALETNFTIVRDDAGSTFTDFASSNLADDENEESLITFDANEPDINVDEPFDVSQAEAQTITGDTNIAPGTELTLRIKSDDGVTPSFLKTASPVVQSDGTYSATLDFSEQSVGDTYTIEVDSATLPDGPVSEDGEVVGSVSTDTATPEPDTATPEPDTATPEPDTATPEPDTATPEPDTATPEPETEEPTSTPTSTPGFGVVVALTALLAAALLAVRRD